MGKTWPKIDVSKKEVRRAGATLRSDDASEAEKADARALAKAWRSAHSYPMNTWQMRARYQARDVPGALIAQRLKRLPSIESKLRRFPNTQLDGIQDLGGVRVVVPSVDDVRRIEGSIVSNSRRHRLVRHDDYLSAPKGDGYRSVHLVHAYGTEASTPWEGYKVELQIRTKLQHTWATGLETVSLFTKQNLKAGRGDQAWREFFALVSAEIAQAEGLPSVPGTPELGRDRHARLLELERRHSLLVKLNGFRHVVQSSHGTNKGRWTLLDLRIDGMLLHTTEFDDREEAARQYAELEREARDDEHRDVVLVSIDDIAQLPEAYPNYFIDLQDFIRIADSALTLRRVGEVDDVFIDAPDGDSRRQ